MALPKLPDQLERAVDTPDRPISWVGLGVGLVGLIGLLVVLALVGELGRFLAASYNVVPFIGLAILAALGITRRWARWLAIIYLISLVLGIILISAALVLMGSLPPGTVGGTAPALTPSQLMAGLLPVAIYCLISLLLLPVIWSPLHPAVNRWWARWLPLRPGVITNTVGLSLALALALLPILALAVLGGRPPLLTLIVALPDNAELSARPIDQIYNLVWLLPTSLVIVGYPLRRRFGEALVRLGLVRPTLFQVGLGLGAAVALVVLATGFEQGIAWLWQSLGWPRTDTQSFQRLMAGLISPLGAVVLGVTAGLGEEIAVRGVLQPRVGLVLANLAFTAAHAYQYGFDALLSVFLIGLVLGVLRQRTNTTTAAITHGVYDFILVLATALNIG